MTTTQNIRDAATQIITLANQIDSTTPTTPTTGGTRPTGVNCIGGSVPNLITIVAGDTDSGAFPDTYYNRKLGNVFDGAVIFIGDSITQDLSESQVTPYGVNFGIGGQSMRRLTNKLRDSKLAGGSAFEHAGAVVIMSGVNDFGNTGYYGGRTNGNAVATVLGVFGNHIKNLITGKWVICHLLPLTAAGEAAAPGYKAQVDAFNSQIATVMAGCAAQIEYAEVPANMLDSNGYLKPEYALPDGQHPSKAGDAVRSVSITAALARLGIS